MRALMAHMGVLLIVSSWGYAQAAKEPAPKAPASQPATTTAPGQGLQGEYRILASVVHLTASQQVMLGDLARQRAKAMEDWDKAHADETTRLRLSLRQARVAKDEQAQQRLGEALGVLESQREALRQQHEAKIEQLMTADQRLAWEQFRLRRMAMRRFQRARLSEEQVQRLEQICSQMAGQVLAVESWEARQQLRNRCLESIAQQVLTLDQRQALESPIQRHRGSRPAPAGVEAVPGPGQNEP